MKILAGLCFLCAGLFFAGTAFAADHAPNPAPPQSSIGSPRDLKAWESQLTQARQQIELLKLFCSATAFGGATINIPPAAQHIPLEKNPAMKNVVKAGIRLEIKEVKLENILLDYMPEPEWIEDRPAFPARIDFSTIGFTVHAKTPLGEFPVKITFRNGKLPVYFACTNEGYTIHVIPEARKAEAQIEDVNIDLGGPNGGRVLSQLFGKQLAQVVLQYGVGQTFKLDKNALMGVNAVPNVLNRIFK